MEEQGIALSEATELIESWMSVRLKRPLKDVEKALVAAAWDDRLYQDIAQQYGLKPDYLKQSGQWFWKTLGLVLNEKVSKKKLKAIVLKKQIELSKTHQIVSDELEQDPSISPELVVLGRKPPTATQYFGYKPELAYLLQSVMEMQCVVLTGPAGVGKSALVVKLIESLKLSPENRFEKVIWQSIHVHKNLDSLLGEIFRLLKLDPYSSKHESSAQVKNLIEFLNQHSFLIVLDGAEDILKGTTQSDRYGENEAYRWFLKEIIEENHASSFMLTSREPFVDLSYAEQRGFSVKNIKIMGIGQNASLFLESQGLIQKEDEFRVLSEKYRGNPLALKLVSSQIRDYFGGQVRAFIDCNTTYIGEPLYQALQAQFSTGYWTSLQRQVISHLAQSTQASHGVLFQDVCRSIQSKDDSVTMSQFIDATNTLYARSLLERQQEDSGEVFLSLQPVIRKFVLTDEYAAIVQALAA